MTAEDRQFLIDVLRNTNDGGEAEQAAKAALAAEARRLELLTRADLAKAERDSSATTADV